MKLVAKNLPIATGNIVVAVLHSRDATLLDLRPNDRILLKHGRRKVVATVDIVGRNGVHRNRDRVYQVLRQGQIGMFLEVQEALGVKTGNTVELSSAKKPESLQYIKNKLCGEKLQPAEIHAIIQDVTKGNLSAVEMAYFVAGSYIYELDMEEVFALTEAMVQSGSVLHFHKKVVVDKHCIGGVAANRTSMLLVPILAAAGLTIPKTSSRSITSAAGTADTVEFLAPIKLSLAQMQRVVKKTNGCLVWGGAMNLAPADDKIIQVEHPVSLDPTGQLLASILAKKKSVSATHVVIDIPLGRGAKVTDMKHAHMLKQKFEQLGKLLGMKILCMITDGSQPVGNGIGPALEARDVLWTLKNSPRGSVLLREKTLFMAAGLFELTRKAKKGKGLALARQILESGKAYEKFIEIIVAQGGKEIRPEDIRLARQSFVVRAPKAGVITHIDNSIMNKIARIAGAPHDQEAGVYLHYHKGACVCKGEKLFTIYSDNKERLQYAVDVWKKQRGVEITYRK